MKYKKYISTLFLGILLLPALSAKNIEIPVEEFDVNSVKFIEQEVEINLGFDTANYLPKGFDPFSGAIDVESVNFIEEDTVDLGFDPSDYLPKDFDPYKK